MASATLFSLSKFRHTGSWLDRALYAFSVYIVPILIAGGTIATLLLLPRQYQATGAITLPFHVLNEHKASLTPADALARLQDAPSTTRFSTQLSETPIWFTFTAPAMGAAHPTLIEFPSRHAQTLSCWVASSMQPLGHGDRQSTTGEIRAVKAGFSVYLGFLANPVPLLCRGTFSGPAQLTALAWDSPNLRNSALDFQESSGLIGGGLLTLAVFVFVTAIINREWTYVIFAVWLVGNLRLCANAMGWDMQWLGRVDPARLYAAVAPGHVRRVLPADGRALQPVVPARAEAGSAIAGCCAPGSTSAWCCSRLRSCCRTRASFRRSGGWAASA